MCLLSLTVSIATAEIAAFQCSNIFHRIKYNTKMSSTVKVLRAKLASCCLSCYLVPPSSAKSPLPISPSTMPSEESNSTPHSPACYHHSASSASRLYQCPQCQTSLPDMSHQWLLMDNERALWIMPQHLKDFKVKVGREKERERGKEGRKRKGWRERERERIFVWVGVCNAYVGCTV